MQSSGLLSLISYVVQDMYLMGGPEISFFKVVYSPKHKAYNLVSKLRMIILAKRRLARLRICREIEHIPGIGIKYFESLDHFSQLHTNQSSPSIPL